LTLLFEVIFGDSAMIHWNKCQKQNHLLIMKSRTHSLYHSGQKPDLELVLNQVGKEWLLVSYFEFTSIPGEVTRNFYSV